MVNNLGQHHYELKVDVFYDLYTNDKISDDDWNLLETVRKLEKTASRSCGIFFNVQSHNANLGMPKCYKNESFNHPKAEKKWRDFKNQLDFFIKQGFLDKAFLDYIFLQTKPFKKFNYSREHTRYSLDVLNNIYNNCSKKKFS
jgi:hypothetical protein